MTQTSAFEWDDAMASCALNLRLLKRHGRSTCRARCTTLALVVGATLVLILVYFQVQMQANGNFAKQCRNELRKANTEPEGRECSVFEFIGYIMMPDDVDMVDGTRNHADELSEGYALFSGPNSRSPYEPRILASDSIGRVRRSAHTNNDHEAVGTTEEADVNVDEGALNERRQEGDEMANHEFQNPPNDKDTREEKEEDDAEENEVAVNQENHGEEDQDDVGNDDTGGHVAARNDYRDEELDRNVYEDDGESRPAAVMLKQDRENRPGQEGGSEIHQLHEANDLHKVEAAEQYDDEGRDGKMNNQHRQLALQTIVTGQHRPVVAGGVNAFARDSNAAAYPYDRQGNDVMDRDADGLDSPPRHSNRKYPSAVGRNGREDPNEVGNDHNMDAENNAGDAGHHRYVQVRDRDHAANQLRLMSSRNQQVFVHQVMGGDGDSELSKKVAMHSRMRKAQLYPSHDGGAGFNNGAYVWSSDRRKSGQNTVRRRGSQGLNLLKLRGHSDGGGGGASWIKKTAGERGVFVHDGNPRGAFSAKKAQKSRPPLLPAEANVTAEAKPYLAYQSAEYLNPVSCQWTKSHSQPPDRPSVVPKDEVTSKIWMESLCKKEDFVQPGRKYFLTAVLLVRVYREDLARLGVQEVLTWLDYLQYSGVDHVLLYDAYHHPNESLLSATAVYRSSNFLTYVDWSAYAKPYGIARTQVRAYQSAIDNYGCESHWQIAIDIDEYPFSPVDGKPGFLARYVSRIRGSIPIENLASSYYSADKEEEDDIDNYELHQDKEKWKQALYKEFNVPDNHVPVYEVTMRNFLHLGAPHPNDERHLFGRYWRRHRHHSNTLVKPIYRCDPRLLTASVHHNKMVFEAASLTATASVLHMNHFWGAREQQWGPDTLETLAKTIKDMAMQPILETFRTCAGSLPSGKSSWTPPPVRLHPITKRPFRRKLQQKVYGMVRAKRDSKEQTSRGLARQVGGAKRALRNTQRRGFARMSQQRSNQYLDNQY